MKIGILSDTHLGFSWGTPRQEDSFNALEEAINTLLNEKVDVIIHAGDLFNSSVVRPEILAKAMHILSETRFTPSETKITNYHGRNPPKLTPKGVPLIVIHGTHERRPRGHVNPIQLLEKAGICIYLHSSGVTLNNQLSIFGLGGVPERYALTALRNFNPKPQSEKNILVLHQSIKEIFNPPSEPATISMEDLPNNFLTICGHIHWSGKKPNLFLPGSVLRTQLNANEPNEKKVWILDGDELKGIELKNNRPFHHHVIKIDGKNPQQIFDESRQVLDKINQKDAIVKLKLVGKLAKGFEAHDIKLEALKKEWPLLYVDRSISTLDSLPELPAGANLDDMLSSALERTIQSRGLKLDTQSLCGYLLSGNMEKVLEVLAQ